MSDALVSSNPIENDTPFQTRHPTWKYASNATFQIVVSIMSSAQGIYLYFFYYSVIGLNQWLIFLALSIFTVYDAIDDPLIGFLVDRNFRWTKKWGRRFPWIVIGIIPWCLSLYLIFSAPPLKNDNPWPVFLWLMMSLIIFDTFGSLVGINVMALRPDLFREEEERQKLTMFWTPFDMIAVALGMLIPPLFLVGGNTRESFALMGAAVAVIALIGAVLFLPGAKEDKIVIDRYFSGEYKKSKFFEGIKDVLKQKSFIIYFIILNVFVISTSLLMSMGPYINNFLLKGSPGDEIFIYVFFLLGALISVPFWLKYLKKIQNNKKVLTIGGFALSFSFIVLSFFQTAIDLYILTFILGISMGSMWAFMYTIIQASVVDDFVATTKKNEKGILLGISVLLGRLVATVDEGIIAGVQTITGFPSGVDSYDALVSTLTTTGGDLALALLGIRVLMGIIPGLILLAGTFIFWKFFPLTPEVVARNKKILEELGF